MPKILTAMIAIPQPAIVPDGLFTHLSETQKMRQFLIDNGYPERAVAMISDQEVKSWYEDELEEQREQEEDEPEPDDTPYNSWERYPWGSPGNNGPLTL